MPLYHSKDPKKLFEGINRFKKDIPRIAGNEATRFFKESFRKQGWQNKSVEKWKPRKRRVGRQTDNRAILVKSGALKRSIRIERYTKNSVIISSELPYSTIHNNGGKINKTTMVRSHQRRTRTGRTIVKAHSKKMNLTIPRRKFMGQSYTLDQIILNSLERRLKQLTK